MNKFGIYENGEVIARFAAPMTVRSNTPVFISESLALTRRIRKSSAQRWEIDSSLEALNGDANTLFAHMVLHGMHTPVNVVMPQPVAAIKQFAGVSPQAVQAASPVGQAFVPTDIQVVVGTFIRFSNHSKIYCVMSCLLGGVSIFPSLRKAVDDTVTISFEDDVIMPAYYDTGTVSGAVFVDGVLMDLGAVKLVEAL